jgi:alpha-L-rhamnosidase
MISPVDDFAGAPLLRAEFALDDGHGVVVSAELAVSSLGVFEAYLNGHAAGPDVLSPGWSSYEWRLRYRTYDVTDLLRPTTVLGICLGNGWSRGRLGWNGNRAVYGDRLAVTAQLEVTFADGHRQLVSTGETWRAGPSATLANDLYDGQTIDARLADDTWMHPGAALPGWGSVETLDFDTSRLTPYIGPPVIRHETLRPVAIWSSPSGRTLVDFGQNLVGWLRFTTQGKAGTEIIVRHGEVLEHGELGVRPLRSAKATDRFILSGGEDYFEPTKTFHGFRYAEISGWPSELTSSSLEAVVVHSDLRRTGYFACSDPTLNQLHANVTWAMRGNFLDVPTDCPQRDERLGWTGDIAVFAPSAAYLYDVDAFLRDWLRDLAAEQRAQDDIVPFVVPDVLKYEPASFPGPVTVAIWSDAAVWVPWALWQAYGDRTVLEDQYASMTAHTRRVESLLSPAGLWDNGLQLGDWLDPQAPPGEPFKADPHVVATACFYRTARTVADTAEVLGRPDDARHFRRVAGRVRAAFNQHYVEENGTVRSDCATVYTLAIVFGLLDDLTTARAGDRLSALVKENGYRISTGFAGTPYVTDALTQTGHLDDACRLLLERDCPSWLYSVTMGATTIWERWDSMLPDGTINPGQMTSFNHYALGAVADWIHRTIGGIAPLEPGYAKVLIAPQPDGGLTWAMARLETAHGLVEVRWHETGQDLTVEAALPAGVTGVIRLPGEPDRELTPGRHTITVPVHSRMKSGAVMNHERPPRQAATDVDWTAGIVAKMSSADKIALACGDFAAVAHLGLPPLSFTDGGNGVRVADDATAFPACVSLAATFDEQLAYRFGSAVGQEARRAGHNVLLGPALDIARTPLGGRQAEAFGEDPCLTGALGAAYVRGVQRNVVAMVKHFVVNNFETGRTGSGWPPADRGPAVDIHVSRRALEEIYFPPFRRALLDAGAGSVMGSYNQVNGCYACQNPELLSTLKDQWGWAGFVAPDFGFAVRDPLAAARAGLDLPGLDDAEGRRPEDFTSGRIGPDRLDDMVTRMVSTMVTHGLLDRPAAVPGPPPAESLELAAEAAVAGSVLLVNRAGALPLGEDVRSLAVIGPAGLDAIYVMGGSPAVKLHPHRVVTPLAGIGQRAGSRVRLEHAQGSWGDVPLPAIPPALLSTPQVPGSPAGPGVLAEYADGPGQTPGQRVTRIEPCIEVSEPPAGFGPQWRATWTTMMTPAQDGDHRFSLAVAGKSSLYLDGALVAEGAREAIRFIDGPSYALQAVIPLVAGQPVTIQVEYETGPAADLEEFGLRPEVRLGWQPPDGLIDDAAALAARCDAAVVIVNQASGEGMDRQSLALPGDQDRLITEVARNNPRTVVVLNTPGPVLMPWLEHVAAVLQVWYPGEQFGTALASVLFGDDDPGGRLPVTFPAHAGQGPVQAVEQYPGIDGVATYTEDILVGYRFFAANNQPPLFPFGHGLSFARFAYENLRVARPGPDDIRLSFGIVNDSPRAGYDVAQLYLRCPAAAAEPPVQLKGFQRVRLKAGERRDVTFTLTAADLAAWNDPGGWTVHPGRYEVLIGASSADVRLSAFVEVTGDHREAVS